MNLKHTNKNQDRATNDLPFSRMDVPWGKSKEEVWQKLEQQIRKEDQFSEPVVRKLPGKQWLALAASLVLLLSVGGFMRFYTINSSCAPASHASISLPDGSTVELNAASEISYQPYWWRFERKVKLEGEAFFQVEKGKKFRVASEKAVTEVLGTSFNIFTRNDEYRVTCHTGSVKVTASSTGSSITLCPKQVSTLEAEGTFSLTNLDHSGSPGWTRKMISFTSTPLRLVLDEIERQYGIEIKSAAEMPQRYSGNFSLEQPVENILSLICIPFDLQYERLTGKTYRIVPEKME